MFETAEAARANSIEYCGVNLLKDEINKDTSSDIEGKMKICISSQDVTEDNANRHPTRTSVSGVSPKIQPDSILKEVEECTVRFKPEIRCNVANNNNPGNDENEILKNELRMRLKNRIMKIKLLIRTVPMKKR